MKKICVINGHPRVGSLSDALVASYVEGAKVGNADVKVLTLRELDFNPATVPEGLKTLTADLKKAQETIEWADHVTIVFPTWWTSVPVLLKGFLDLTFITGWGFKYQSNGMPKGLLTGKSARIMHTCGAPAFVNKWIYSEPEVKMLKKGILKFCGFGTVRVSKFGSVMGDKPNLGAKFLPIAKAAGIKDAKG